jgi:hypothetical protein
MATSNNVDAFDVDEDCDVVFEGSPLHEHLRKFGMSEEVESRQTETEKSKKTDRVVEKKSSRLSKSTKKSSNDSKGYFYNLVQIEEKGESICKNLSLNES